MASFQANAGSGLGFLLLNFGILPVEGKPGLHCEQKTTEARAFHPGQAVAGLR